MRKIEDYIALAEKAVGLYACPKGARPEGLYAPIAYGLSQGGKRLRPAILLAACDAVGGDCEKAMHQAAAVEAFHNFTLLHDDVMDNADLRRGKPTVRRRWGDNAAILSGDAMLTLATRQVAEGVPAERAVKLLGVFSDMAMAVYEGQQYDMEFEGRDSVTVGEYMAMIELKTAALLAGSCRMGAMMGGAGKDRSDALADFARNIGLAFQLQDDWLDVYGDPKVFGKAVGGDIMNNKKTYLLITAMEKATGSDRKELERWIAADSPFAGEKIAAVTAIYDRLCAGDICRDAVALYCDKAVDALRRARLEGEAEDFFGSFVGMLMDRKK